MLPLRASASSVARRLVRASPSPCEGSRSIPIWFAGLGAGRDESLAPPHSGVHDFYGCFSGPVRKNTRPFSCSWFSDPHYPRTVGPVCPPFVRFYGMRSPWASLKKNATVSWRLEFLGKVSAAFSFFIFAFVAIVSLVALVVVSVQVWRIFSVDSFWGSVVVTSFAGFSLFFLLSMLLILVAFMLEATLGPANVRLCYVISILRRISGSVPLEPPTLFEVLSHYVPSRLSQFLSQTSRDLSSDDFAPPRMYARLRTAEGLLSDVDARLTSALASPQAAATALPFLQDRLSFYDPPPVHLHSSSPSAPPIPPSTYEDEAVLFFLNGRHRVESLRPVALSAEQFALAAVLRNLTREVVKSRHVRLMVAPGWLHALLARDYAAFEYPHVPILPPVSEAYPVKDPHAVAELLASIWAPPLGFVRALAAAEKLNAISRISLPNP